MTIAAVRKDVADALSTIADVTVRAYPVQSATYGDGWLSLAAIAPGPYLQQDDVTFTAMILLGNDIPTAEARFESLAPLVLAALTEGDLPAAKDVRIIPEAVFVGSSSTPVPALSMSFTLEVDRA